MNKFINNVFYLGVNKIILLSILIILFNLIIDNLIIDNILMEIHLQDYIRVVRIFLYILSIIFFVVVIYNFKPIYKRKKR